jgi:hypothetical protein
MELSELAGKHVLTGVDRFNGEAGYYGPEEAITFRLDDTTYTIREDQSDGYRSYARDVEVSDIIPTNSFPPVEVLAVYDGESRDTITLHHAESGAEILVVGTDQTDDYYPSFECRYDPTALGFPPMEPEDA